MRTICLALLLAAVVPVQVSAQRCTEPDRCITAEDYEYITDVLQEKRCLSRVRPNVSMDRVTITVDSDQHFEGWKVAAANVHLNWCEFNGEVPTYVEVQTQPRFEPALSFRWRFKAAAGLLLRDLIGGQKVIDTGDVGLMIEPVHYHRLTLNTFVSFRSAGAGVGYDITDKFGVVALLNASWHDWRLNPFLGVYLGF